MCVGEKEVVLEERLFGGFLFFFGVRSIQMSRNGCAAVSFFFLGEKHTDVSGFLSALRWASSSGHCRRTQCRPTYNLRHLSKTIK